MLNYHFLIYKTKKNSQKRNYKSSINKNFGNEFPATKISKRNMTDTRKQERLWFYVNIFYKKMYCFFLIKINIYMYIIFIAKKVFFIYNKFPAARWKSGKGEKLYFWGGKLQKSQIFRRFELFSRKLGKLRVADFVRQRRFRRRRALFCH